MLPEFHVDILTLGVVTIGVIVTWANLSKDSKWHTSWIKNHDAECNEQRKFNNHLLTELQINQAKLTQLSETNSGRLNRIERNIDRG